MLTPIFEILSWFFIDIILVPIAWIVMTPYVLIRSAFGKEKYWTQVWGRYRAIAKYILG